MVLVSSVAAVRFIIVCGAVAIVKELPGVSKSIRRWPLIISIRSLAILTDFELRRFSRYGKTDRDSYDV